MHTGAAPRKSLILQAFPSISARTGGAAPLHTGAYAGLQKLLILQAFPSILTLPRAAATDRFHGVFLPHSRFVNR